MRKALIQYRHQGDIALAIVLLPCFLSPAIGGVDLPVELADHQYLWDALSHYSLYTI